MNWVRDGLSAILTMCVCAGFHVLFSGLLVLVVSTARLIFFLLLWPPCPRGKYRSLFILLWPPCPSGKYRSLLILLWPPCLLVISTARCLYFSGLLVSW